MAASIFLHTAGAAFRRTARNTCRRIPRRPNVFVHLQSDRRQRIMKILSFSCPIMKLYILQLIDSFFQLPHIPFIASSSPFSSFGRSLAPQSTHLRVFVRFAIYSLSAVWEPTSSCLLYSFFVSAVSPPFLSFFSPLGSCATFRETMGTC